MIRSLFRLLGTGFCFLSLACSCTPIEKEGQEDAAAAGVASPAPVLLPGTVPRMNTPGFWIGMHPDPDRVVIPAGEIPGFNRSIRHETRMVQDIASYARTVKGPVVSDMLKGSLRSIAARKYVLQDGLPATGAFFKTLEKEMNLSAVPARVNVRFALVTSCTHQRLLPTGVGLYSSARSMDVDRLQNSSLDIGTPLAVFHATRDGSWVYAASTLSEGWVKAQDVGFCSRDDVGLYLNAEPFVVTVRAKTDLYLDEKLRDHLSYAKMGCRFPAKSTGEERAHRIMLPFRNEDGQCAFGEAYVAGGDVSEGYLPYTPRTIILQAFDLLHSPYGWGDMHGEQDCSRFIEEIFSTVGIQLPRNSLQQARVGTLIASFNGSVPEEQRRGVLSQSSHGGTSILHMKGHIMLYLGCVGGDPYAIHDMQSYSEPTPEGERRRVVNRVVVSNLRLGEGTRTGPILKRLVTVRALEKKSS